MAHIRKPLDDLAAPLISRRFVADMVCAEHGTPLGVVLVQGPVGPAKADEILASASDMLGVRHSGLVEVTDYQEFARLIASGIYPW